MATDLFTEPCNLQDMYIIQNNSSYSWLSSPFGYFVRVRDLNLKLDHSVINIDGLTTAIQDIWFKTNKVNNTFQESAVKVSIANQQKYVSYKE